MFQNDFGEILNRFNMRIEKSANDILVWHHKSGSRYNFLWLKTYFPSTCFHPQKYVTLEPYFFRNFLLKNHLPKHESILGILKSGKIFQNDRIFQKQQTKGSFWKLILGWYSISRNIFFWTISVNKPFMQTYEYFELIHGVEKN